MVTTYVHRQWWIQDLAEEGAKPRVNLLFGKIFVEICMKMKEIRPGVGKSVATLGSATA